MKFLKIGFVLLVSLIFSNCSLLKHKKLDYDEKAIYQQAFDTLKTFLYKNTLVVSSFSADQDRSWFCSSAPKKYKNRFMVGYSLDEPYLEVLRLLNQTNKTLSSKINLCFFSPIDKNRTIIVEVFHNVPRVYIEKKRSEMPYPSGSHITMYCFLFDKQNNMECILKTNIVQ